MNKTLFGVSLVGLIFSFIFMIVSIWNNTDWMLLERGYYTFGIITVTVSVYIAIQLTLDFNGTGVLGKLNTAISSIFAGVAIIFMAFIHSKHRMDSPRKGLLLDGASICSDYISYGCFDYQICTRKRIKSFYFAML